MKILEKMNEEYQDICLKLGHVHAQIANLERDKNFYMERIFQLQKDKQTVERSMALDSIETQEKAAS
jgi:catechol-2,3-dioxygenase